MTDDIAARIAARRLRWQQMPPEQQIQCIQDAVLSTIEIARWRRQRRRRQSSNDYLTESNQVGMEFRHVSEPN